MAQDPNPVEITITSSADTSGLDKASEATDGLAESTKKLDETAKGKGLSDLFNQQRLIEIGRQFERLGETVRSFAQKAAETEKGREALAGLSDATEVYGKVAGGVAAATAQGFAQGGPIGAGIAALTSLISSFADEWLDAQKRIEQSNKEFDDAVADQTERMRERKRVASDRAIEDAFQRENEILGDQNQKLTEQQRLLELRRELEKETFEEGQEVARGKGKSEADIRRDRIRFEAEQENQRINDEEARIRLARDEAEARRKAALDRREALRERGTESKDFQDADKNFQAADEAYDDASLTFERSFGGLNLRRAAVTVRTRRRLTEENRREREEAEREQERAEEKREQEEKRAADKEKRERDRKEREERQKAEERRRLGLQGESIADQAAGLTRENPRQSRALEEIGNNLARNPTAGGADALGDALESLARGLTGRDEDQARKYRALAEKVRRLEAQIKKGGDGR